MMTEICFKIIKKGVGKTEYISCEAGDGINRVHYTIFSTLV